jgi:hypothetical protein
MITAARLGATEMTLIQTGWLLSLCGVAFIGVGLILIGIGADQVAKLLGIIP